MTHVGALVLARAPNVHLIKCVCLHLHLPTSPVLFTYPLPPRFALGVAAVPSPPAEAGRAHVPVLHDLGKRDRCHVPPAHSGNDGALPQACE